MQRENFDLDTFKKQINDLIATSDTAWNETYGRQRTTKTRQYSLEDINKIIDEGSVDQKRKLSYDYFQKDGFYRRIIFYYATLLTYTGMVIPNPMPGKKLSEKSLTKRYNQAVWYISKIPLKELFTRMSVRALIDGSYYGAVLSKDKDSFIVLDLPMQYARSRFRDFYGNDIVEFNVQYFDQINDAKMRTIALKNYPKEIASHYKKYKSGKTTDPWVRLSSSVGLCFSFSDDGVPTFLNVIPATVQYDDAVETERERELEEIRKIIVQKIPHLNDGQLLFEPEEAVEMHRGMVNMLKGNKNLSVLTSYGDVDAIVSRTAADSVANNLNNMLFNIYNEAGTSPSLFTSENGQVIKYNIKNDLSLMMILGNKYSRFMSNLLNELFGNPSIRFKYQIFPYTLYLRTDDITDSFKLAQSGYSFLMPALAAGIDPSELLGLKELENDVMNLGEILIPLQSAYTQSAAAQEETTQKKVAAENEPEAPTDEGGRPPKEVEDKDPDTIRREG